uniref:Uncharacterized protein n=1 Tax=Cannabis sativa TaxID=3483 RepID=A0A803RAN1_CANSA
MAAMARKTRGQKLGSQGKHVKKKGGPSSNIDLVLKTRSMVGLLGITSMEFLDLEIVKNDED